MRNSSGKVIKFHSTGYVGVTAMLRVDSAGNNNNSNRPRKEKRLTYVLNDTADTKHCAGINCLAVHKSSASDGSDYLFTGSRDGTLKKWALGENTATCSATFESHVDWVNDTVIAGDSTLVSCSSDTTLKTWNCSSDGTCTRTFRQHSDYVTCLAAADKNANIVTSGGLGGEVFVWDIEAAVTTTSKSNDVCHGYVPIAAKGHKESVYALAMNDSGSLLVSGGTEKVVRVCDPRTGSKNMKLRGHTDNIRALLLDSTGRYCLSGSSDSMIRLWDLGQQHCVHSYAVHTDSVWALASTPTFSHVYSGGRDLSDNEVLEIIERWDWGMLEVFKLYLKWKPKSEIRDSSVSRWPAEGQNPRNVFQRGGSFLAGNLSYSRARVSLEGSTPGPVYKEPNFTIAGTPAIVQHEVLNNRRHVLTKDAAGSVKLWEITKGVVIEDYGQTLVYSWFALRVGNGESISFWNDVWADECSLKFLFPRIFVLSTNKEGKIAEFGSFEPSGWVWNVQTRRSLSDWELVQWMDLMSKLKDIQLSELVEDFLSWAASGDGMFSTKSCRSSLGPVLGSNTLWSKGVWLGFAPPRVEAFLWQLAHQKVAVKAELVKRGLPLGADILCPLCKDKEEMMQHLFISCDVVWELWNKLASFWDVSLVLPQDPPILISWGYPLDRLSLFFIVRFRLSKWFLAKFPKITIHEDVLMGGFPPADFLKLNVDGAVRLDGSGGGIGGILRDWNGCTLLTFSENVGVGTHPLAELKAIKRGIEIFLSSSWESSGRLIVESDCSSAVEWIQSPVLAPVIFSHLVYQISTLITGKVSFDEKKEELFEMVSIPAWFTVDTRLGSLSVHLETPQCFTAEMYSADLNISGKPEDDKVNLAREVLKGLLANWLSKRKQSHGSQASANGDILSGKDAAARSAAHSRIEVDGNAENDSMVYPPFEFSTVSPPSIITEGSQGGPRRMKITELDATEDEKDFPSWVLDCVLNNRLPPRENTKCSFYLHPCEGSAVQILTQGKLSAPRILRMHKVVNYVIEKLVLDKPIDSVSTDGLGGQSQSGSKPWQKLRPSIEILCNNQASGGLAQVQSCYMTSKSLICCYIMQVLSPYMSLATVRAYIWKKPNDLVLNYRVIQSRGILFLMINAAAGWPSDENLELLQSVGIHIHRRLPIMSRSVCEIIVYMGR
ncbi:WD repeat-containing protein 48-like protein isoform 2 [Hibiscus syriacus]|uniref:WD repeat-containing protein 48-like protein isoform 2 n=1 Tax=Hibiscus syriacus TaxID=106335 RepID=A0A6A2ZX40_HIBSY|nr:WD repeat-containing protein 48-like protein isoform 2 [Hibiscus syriacus]